MKPEIRMPKVQPPPPRKPLRIDLENVDMEDARWLQQVAALFTDPALESLGRGVRAGTHCVRRVAGQVRVMEMHDIIPIGRYDEQPA